MGSCFRHAQELMGQKNGGVAKCNLLDLEVLIKIHPYKAVGSLPINNSLTILARQFFCNHENPDEMMLVTKSYRKNLPSTSSYFWRLMGAVPNTTYEHDLDSGTDY